MSTRGFLILLIATVVAVVVGIVAAVQPTISSADLVVGEPMFLALEQSVAEASTVTVQTPQYTMTWQQRDGAWVSPERGDYPARGTSVSDLVQSLARLTKVEPKTSKPEWLQYIRVGDPAATPPTGVAHVTVSSASGQVLADAILGSRSFGIPASHIRGGMFVRANNEPQSWLVEGTATVPTEVPEWFETVIDLPGNEIASVSILVGDRPVFEAKKSDPVTGAYEIVQLDPPAKGSVANANGIRSMASALVGLRVEDVRAADSVSPGPDSRTVRFTTVSGLQLDVLLSDADGKTWATFKASAPDGSEAAATASEINRRTANWAFLLNDAREAQLSQPMADLVLNPADTDPAADGIGRIMIDENGRPILSPQQIEPGPVLPGAQTQPIQ